MVGYKTAIKRMEIKLQHAGTLKEINSKKKSKFVSIGSEKQIGDKKKKQSHRLPQKRYYGRKRVMNTLRMC